MSNAHLHRTTLDVDVYVPNHAPRKTSALFKRTRGELIEREGGRCWVCGRTVEDTGQPPEAHHHPIEWCMALMIDWDRFRKDAEAGVWGPHAQAFDWSRFDPADPYTFVDDMTVNGKLLCKRHHTADDEGIHMLPFPVWIAQKYGKEGYQFSDDYVIHHAESSND